MEDLDLFKKKIESDIKRYESGSVILLPFLDEAKGYIVEELCNKYKVIYYKNGGIVNSSKNRYLLTQYDYDDSYFNADLTSKEQSILAMIIVYEWFLRETQDVRQFNNHLQTRDFKVFSEANNLKQKSDYSDKLREKYLYEIQQYQLNKLDDFWEV